MTSVYDFSAKLLNGEDVSLSRWQGQVLLIVNTASQCGFTPQYAGLEDLYEQFGDEGLTVLGFPCNQFGGQEPGGSAEIAEFCARNYRVSFPLFEKIETIAREIYRAKNVTADKSVKDQLKTWEEMGYGKLPICVAKTQYSFSTNPDAKGAPSDHTINVREVRLSAGAEFVVAICGEIMTMPGLPKVPSAEFIRLENGQIEGLF